jgi:predicted XRE-type DNA-binding protein
MKMKMSDRTNRCSHVMTEADVFDDLNFSPTETVALKLKAGILSALLKRIRQQRYTQSKLAGVLGDYQPNISNLLSGKISKMSVENCLSARIV